MLAGIIVGSSEKKDESPSQVMVDVTKAQADKDQELKKVSEKEYADQTWLYIGADISRILSPEYKDQFESEQKITRGLVNAVIQTQLENDAFIGVCKKYIDRAVYRALLFRNLLWMKKLYADLPEDKQIKVLFDAVKEGWLEFVAFVDQNPDFKKLQKAKNGDGETLLQVATNYKQTAIVELLSNPVAAQSTTSAPTVVIRPQLLSGAEALAAWTAIKKFEAFIDKYVEPEGSKGPENPIKYYPQWELIKLVIPFLQFDAKILQEIKFDLNDALIFMCKWGNLRLACDIIRALNYQAKDLKNAFFAAVEFGQVDIVKYFIEQKGVSESLRTDVDGETALHLAVRADKVEVAKYLLEKFPGLKTTYDGNGVSVMGRVETALVSPDMYDLFKKELAVEQTPTAELVSAIRAISPSVLKGATSGNAAPKSDQKQEGVKLEDSAKLKNLDEGYSLEERNDIVLAIATQLEADIQDEQKKSILVGVESYMSLARLQPVRLELGDVSVVKDQKKESDQASAERQIVEKFIDFYFHVFCGVSFTAYSERDRKNIHIGMKLKDANADLAQRFTKFQESSNRFPEVMRGFFAGEDISLSNIMKSFSRDLHESSLGPTVKKPAAPLQQMPVIKEESAEGSKPSSASSEPPVVPVEPVFTMPFGRPPTI